MSKHWLDGVTAILESESANLRELAQASHLDPATFYLGTTIRNVDLRGQDLRDLQFSEMDFSSIEIDFNTRLPHYTIVFETTKGSATLALRPDLAPKHVAHLRRLITEEFYDGLTFHRVIDGFMAQTGCPNGTGTGGSKYPNLKKEFNSEPHVRGICSMARAQNPDSANSQFFICYTDASFLNSQYTVFGKIVEGMDNIDKLKRGEPVQTPDRILTARLI